MRFYFIVPAILFGLIATSCNVPNRYRCIDEEDILQEKYVHKYGVEVQPEDWSVRGECGQVISSRTDGVTETRCYDQGILHGDSTYTFPHSTVVAKRQNFEQGHLVEETAYYRSGCAEKRVSFLSPSLQKITTWYESGEPKSEETYENGLILEGFYYTPDHVLESKIDNGEGEHVCRDAYGQIIGREQIFRGKVVRLTTLHPNGAPHQVIPLKNGNKHGLVQVFLPDGEPVCTEEWSQGVQHGVTTLFENGECVSTIPYEDGVVHGIERKYREGEVLAARVTWVDGKRHGPTYHHVDGKISTQWYYNDSPVSQNDFEVLMSYRQRKRTGLD